MPVQPKRTIALLLCAALLTVLGAAPAAAQEAFEAKEITAESMTADAVLARPLGVCATALGAAFFFVGLPFSALGGNAGESWSTMVGKPAQFTFQRPLGEF